jgi:hypothetical protein
MEKQGALIGMHLRTQLSNAARDFKRPDLQIKVNGSNKIIRRMTAPIDCTLQAGERGNISAAWHFPGV